MPVPSNGVLQALAGPSSELIECLDRADAELRNASAGLASVGSQLEALRQVAAGDAGPQPEVGACGSGSLVQDPPALILHQTEKRARRKPQEPRFRRASGTGAQEDVSLRLHGRWMELSTQAGGDVAVKDKGSMMHLHKLRQTFSSTRDDLDKILHRKFRVLHPQGFFKLCWDILALGLLLNDAILLPPTLAWDVPMAMTSAAGMYVRLSFFVSLVFWTIDLPINLNTAVYVKGTLAMGRYEILKYYFQSWMIFDILIIAFDYLFIIFNLGQTDLHILRFARILRVLRLIRIIKLSKLNTMIEESAAAAGRQWVTLVVAITKTGVGMIMVAHFLTCFWYFTGEWIVGYDSGVLNWIEFANARAENGVDPIVQYLHALRWILNAPSPPDLDPASGIERGVDIFISITTLVVIGSAISKISGTMAELRAMNEESARRRREVRLYLASQSVSYELVTRIMRFVDYKLEKVSANNMDSSLISPTLQLELYVNQRAEYLVKIPIFALAQEVYPEMFGSICAAFTKNFFEKGEAVFTAGSYSTALHITFVGSFENTKDHSPPQPLEGVNWFGELSLYCDPVWHESTLTPLSFGETFSLQSQDLVDCIKSNRGCSGMFCEYAKDFLAAMQKTQSKFGDDDQHAQAENCCKQNQHFQAAYPDPKTLFANIIICGEAPPPSVVEEAKSEAPSSPGAVEVPCTSKPDMRSSNTYESVLSRLSDGSSGTTQLSRRVEILEDQGLRAFVDAWMSSDKDCDASQLPQADSVKLLESQWLELQQIISWIEPEPEEVHAVLVLLAIRGLGKSKTVMQQLPAEMRRPERGVIHLSQSRQNVVPSIRWLSERGVQLFEEALITHELFNLAQMLQGENSPGNVKELRVHIEQKGDAIFRFYILFLLGFMSGLAAGQGSRFMNAKNADATIGGIRVLQKLMTVNATAIYWGYLALRAEKLMLPFNSPEDLVLVRLACLARVQDQKGYESLRFAWLGLGKRERTSLTDHFLADGVEELAFVLEFLPNCVANAKANPLIGLTCLLDVLTDLLATLRTKVATMPKQPKLLPVDLSDMGEFISAVRNRFVFTTCISRCQLKFAQQRVRVEMTGGNWGRANDRDSDLTSIAYTIQDLVMKQEKVQDHFSQGCQES